MAKPAVLDAANMTNHTSFTATGLDPTPGVGFSKNVYIENRPAIPAGSKFLLHDVPPNPLDQINPARRTHQDIVLTGCPTVYCNGTPMGRVGDQISSPPDMVPPLSPAGYLRAGGLTVNLPDTPGIPIFTAT